MPRSRSCEGKHCSLAACWASVRNSLQTGVCWLYRFAWAGRFFIHLDFFEQQELSPTKSDFKNWLWLGGVLPTTFLERSLDRRKVWLCWANVLLHTLILGLMLVEFKRILVWCPCKRVPDSDKGQKLYSLELFLSEINFWTKSWLLKQHWPPASHGLRDQRSFSSPSTFLTSRIQKLRWSDTFWKIFRLH